MGLNPSLRDLVLFDGDRWVCNGLEKDTRDCISSAAVSSHLSRAPNVLRAMAEKIPNSRPLLGPLRVSPDDVPALGPIDKSAVTKVFWSKVWDRRASVPSSDRAKFLEGYRKVLDSSLCSKPDLDLVTDIINRPNNSAPGPDGIPFAAWRAVADIAAPILLNVSDAIADGRVPPDGFNHGLLYRLPKKDTGLLSDTRLLSVTNTDNRILAAVVARGIMPAVDALVDLSKEFFGRQE